MSDVQETRERNMKSMEKNTTSNLSGGVMPRDLFDEFYQRVQEETLVLDMVRTEQIGRHQTAIPKIGVGERLMQEQSDGSSVSSYETADTGSVDIDVVKTVVPFKLSNEAVEDTVDDVEEVLLSQFQRQFGVDAEDLGINGDETSGTAFEAINNGWIAIAEGQHSDNRIGGSTMPTYSHTDGSGNPQAVDTAMFNNTIQTLENKYLRTDPVFFMNADQVQQYAFDLTNRDTPLGDSVLFGDADMTPFNYDVVASSMWPEDKAMFTAPSNLIWALRRDVEIDVVESSDDTLEEDLLAKYALRARHDYQIEDLQAGVLVTDLAAPTA